MGSATAKVAIRTADKVFSFEIKRSMFVIIRIRASGFLKSAADDIFLILLDSSIYTQMTDVLLIYTKLLAILDKQNPVSWNALGLGYLTEYNKNPFA